MNKQRARRLSYIALLLAGIAVAAGLILYSLKQNINLFFTPSQALQASLPLDHHFRLGGQVKAGSIKREKDSLVVHFVLTDLKKDIPVVYEGILPDLFKEGNGAIAEGQWSGEGKLQVFKATEILAKHDEKYMPRQVYEALRQNAQAPQ